MLYAIVAVIILILDQAIKYWTSTSLAVGATTPLIPGFVQLTNIQNTGAAFGILKDARWFLIVLTLAAVIAAIVLISKNIVNGKLGRWMLIMVIAGGLGNCIDRLFNGYVVDMFQFQFKIFGQDFAIFNVADIFITVGGIIFCIYLIFHKEPEKEESAPSRSSAREMARPTERPAVRTDYITQLKRPVVEGRKNIEAEIAAKAAETAHARGEDSVVTDWSTPDFIPVDTVPEAKPVTEPETPSANSPKPEPSPTDFDTLFKATANPAKKNDSDFNIDDIIAEFKDI